VNHSHIPSDTRDLYGARAEAVREARRLFDLAAAHGGTPTPNQQRDFDAAMDRAVLLTAKLNEARLAESREAAAAVGTEPMPEPMLPVVRDLEVLEGKGYQAPAPIGARDLAADAGNRFHPQHRPPLGAGVPGEVRRYRFDERMARGSAPSGMGSAGAIVRGAVTGDWSGIDPEVRALSAGSATGSYIVPTPLAERVIDLARNRMVTGRLGVTTIPMDSLTLKMARVASDVTAEWKSENSAATASDMTLEQVTFTARTLIAYCKLSEELWQDGEGIDAAVENSLAQALALELDRVVLRGSGTPPEPDGIRNQSNVTITAVTGAVDQDDILDAYATILGNNHTPNGMAMSTRTFIGLAKQKEATGDYAEWHPLLAALQKEPTTQIPTNLGGGGTYSELYLGDWSQCMLGVRRTLQLDVTREASDSAGYAFNSYQVWVRAVLRADVQLAHPEAFAVLTEITN